MKKLIVVFILLAPLLCLSQRDRDRSINTLVNAGDGLYYLYHDSSGLKSTIVEFDQYIALLEVLIRDEGGVRILKDHTNAGNKVLRTLKYHFPDKPLKYVMHSHWHPHSISSIEPFLKSGATLITTAKNFEKLKGALDSSRVEKYVQNIQFVDSDSLVVSDPKNRIVIHRFLQQDYGSTPTFDYLFFYLPNYKALHSGCMYNRWEGAPVRGKEVRTSREEDMHKLMLDRHIRPEYFIRLLNDMNEEKNMIAYEKFAHVISDGISSRDILEKYWQLDAHTLEGKRDSLIADAVATNIPASLFNSMVYKAIRGKDLRRALIYAHYQALLNPSDPNAWDTLGEVHYLMGNSDIARTYGKQAKLISPSFTRGGELVWKETLAQFQEQRK